MDRALYIAIHKHEYGTDVKVFTATGVEDPAETFNALPENDVVADDDGEFGALTQVDFALRLNIDFEPEIGEELSIMFIDVDRFEDVNFSDFA